MNSPIMLTCNIMRFISLLLLGLDACVVCVVMWSSLSVCKVVLVAYVYTVVAVTVIRVLLFSLDVCMLGECKGGYGQKPCRTKAHRSKSPWSKAQPLNSKVVKSPIIMIQLPLGVQSVPGIL